MICILCGKEKVKLIGEIKPEYSWLRIEIPKFDVYDCEICDTRFVYPNVVPKNFYDSVFKDTDLYENQLKLSRSMLLDEDPPFALLSRGQPYYALFEFLKHKRNLRIFDIGCSYGHVVWALGLLGHTIGGIDISKNAIEVGKNVFGQGLPIFNMELHDFIENYKGNSPDLILAMDVIEHLSNPLDFIKECISFLRNHGSLFITTPNRSFYKKENMPHLRSFNIERGNIWFTDYPPVHLSLFTKKSMEYVANQFGLVAQFIEFPGLADLHGEGSTLAVVFIK